MNAKKTVGRTVISALLIMTILSPGAAVYYDSSGDMKDPIVRWFSIGLIVFAVCIAGIYIYFSDIKIGRELKNYGVTVTGTVEKIESEFFWNRFDDYTRWFIYFNFNAIGPDGNSAPVHQRNNINSELRDAFTPGSTIGLRYSSRNPLIVRIDDPKLVNWRSGFDLW